MPLMTEIDDYHWLITTTPVETKRKYEKPRLTCLGTIFELIAMRDILANYIPHLVSLARHDPQPFASLDDYIQRTNQMQSDLAAVRQMIRDLHLSAPRRREVQT